MSRPYFLSFLLNIDRKNTEYRLFSSSIGSQHKHVERLVRPVFPDYLFVSCDYELNEYLNNVALMLL